MVCKQGKTATIPMNWFILQRQRSVMVGTTIARQRLCGHLAASDELDDDTDGYVDCIDFDNNWKGEPTVVGGVIVMIRTCPDITAQKSVMVSSMTVKVLFSMLSLVRLPKTATVPTPI